MAENNRTRRLAVATILFVSLIIIGLITFRLPDIKYTLSPPETIEILTNESYSLSSDEFNKYSQANSPAALFIDLRNQAEYDMHHFKGSINIPVSEILGDYSLDLIKEANKKSQKVLLWSNDRLVTNGTWMLLRQIGFENLKVLFKSDLIESVPGTGSDAYFRMNPAQHEKPAYNFSEIMQANSHSSENSEQAGQKTNQVVPERKVKKSNTVGGC